jgi:hypothetical protein
VAERDRFFSLVVFSTAGTTDRVSAILAGFAIADVCVSATIGLIPARKRSDADDFQDRVRLTKASSTPSVRLELQSSAIIALQ